MSEEKILKMNPVVEKIAQIIFLGRWLQAPLYVGLIVILAAYVYKFLGNLFHLVYAINGIEDSQLMLGVLDLIDVVMIANLLIMVIMGGYETFVSHLNIKNHPDNPEWLREVDAGTMKIKLALSLIGISSIHLLRTFIDPSHQTYNDVMWQVLIHLTLVISAIAIAYTNRIMSASH
jgi:uncharacterized protein (TIGR00645 family)